MNDSGKAVPNSHPVGSKPAIDSSTTTANVTSIASSSKPVTNVQSTIETTCTKPKATNQNTASPNNDEQLANALAISESKPKSAVTSSVPSAASTVSTKVAKPSHDVAKTDSTSNNALVSTNIERSTTTLTETSTMTSTSTQWTRTQSPQGTIRYRENTDVRVKSAVDKKTITKEKLTLAIKASENSANEKAESKNSGNEKPESNSSANKKPESQSSANEKSESKSSANEITIDGSAVITAGVGLTLVPVDDSSSGAPRTKNSEISDKENEVPNNQIVKSDGEETETEKSGSEGTGSETDHTGNALEVILMTDDGNKKPEKSSKSETSEKKSNKEPKKKQKKPLNAVKSSKISTKNSNIVKKYNRKYFGQYMLKLRPSTFNFRNDGILI